jgi:hypothetical protein
MEIRALLQIRKERVQKARQPALARNRTDCCLWFAASYQYIQLFAGVLTTAILTGLQVGVTQSGGRH